LQALLLSSRPFKIGDRIKTEESDELVGDVIEISLLYTKIKTVRNELVTIPNQTLLQNQIVNHSGMNLFGTSVEISITYQNNRKVAESLLIDSANTEGKFLKILLHLFLSRGLITMLPCMN
jgi:small-conductance mechanosensitive channel